MLGHLEGHKFKQSQNKSTNGLVVSSVYLPRSLSQSYSSGTSPDKFAHRKTLSLPGKQKHRSSGSNSTSETIQFNIMDFGGQELFHSTHRLFLTANALYIVMFKLSDPRTFNRVEYPIIVVTQYWLCYVLQQ